MKQNIPKTKERVVFYLSIDDKELLTNQCELMQIKASFFIRNSVLEKLGKPIFNVKKQDLDTKKYSSDLLRIGSNLNQISKKLNSGVKLMLVDQNTLLNEIKNINNHILEIKYKL